MKIELCDLCEQKEPNYRFKIKMSRKGHCYDKYYGWIKFWQPYETICICEDCAEKLLGIESEATRMKKRREHFKPSAHRKQIEK